jgi:DNA primase
MSTQLNLDAIRSEHHLAAVVSGAGVKLQHSGTEWKACCPLHADRTPSFTIFDSGRRFHCFGCGASGDVLDFLQQLHGIGLRAAAEMLTRGYAPTALVGPLPAHDERARLEEARAIWRNAVPAQGTLAETYLRSRCLEIAIPKTIRFSALRYGKKGREYPVLVGAITGPDNKLCGIQRTYLAQDGKGKADVPKAKLSLGRVSGGAIRLAPAAGELTVTEGLEDGLSLQQQRGGAVWVAAGASMLPKMDFPELVRAIAIGGDADDAGRAAARAAADAYIARGLVSRVFFPVAAKDFNDELQRRHRCAP